MKCVDKKGHEYGFVGYMVVCEEIQGKTEKGRRTPQPGTAGPVILKLPEHFSAKIEVWQCLKCGHIKLAPAVFTRL